MGIDTELNFDAVIDTSKMEKADWEIFDYWFKHTENPSIFPEHEFFNDKIDRRAMWRRVGWWENLTYKFHGLSGHLAFTSYPKNWGEHTANQFADYMSKFIDLDGKDEVIVGHWGEECQEYGGYCQDNLIVGKKSDSIKGWLGDN